jgi:glyoxylate carboligase
MPISKNQARQLAKTSMEMGARVLRGSLTVAENGVVSINHTELVAWLAEFAGSEVILVASPVGWGVIDEEVKSCYTCGRDYTGDACPHCAQVRSRLRG